MVQWGRLGSRQRCTSNDWNGTGGISRWKCSHQCQVQRWVLCIFQTRIRRKNKIEELCNDAKFSATMKTDSSIQRKIKSYCKGKATMIATADKGTISLVIIVDVDDTVLKEYHQLILDTIFWRFTILLFGSNHEGRQNYITLKPIIQGMTTSLKKGTVKWSFSLGHLG